MKSISLTVLLVCAILVNACGNQNQAEHPDDEDLTEKTGAASGDQNTPAANITHSERSCCMQSVEDFMQFLPDNAGEFVTKRKGSANLFCLDDPETASSSRRSYFDADGHKFSVTLKDYCAHAYDDFKHLADVNVDPANQTAEGELKLLDVDGTYKGFAKYFKQDSSINNGNPAYVKVIVDRRFFVQVQSLEQTGVSEVLALFNALPISSLADFGK